LKNKIDDLKKDYTFFVEFKNLATGLGWDEAKQTVECSDEWWDEHLAVSGIIRLWYFSTNICYILCLTDFIFYLISEMQQ
jgi:hypothetical protein